MSKIAKLSLLLFAFNFSAFSAERDCIQEYVNYALYLDVRLYVSGEYYSSSEKKRIDCTPSIHNKYLNDFISTTEHSIKYNKINKDRMRAEMKLKKTLSVAKYFPEQFIALRGPEVSHDEFCEIFDAQVVKWSSCPGRPAYDNQWRSIDITHGDLVKVCNEHIPGMIKYFESCH